MNVKRFGREIVESVTDAAGAVFTLQRGKHTELIARTWRGKLTRRSKRETTQTSLMMRGPIGWKRLRMEWDAIKARG